MAGSGRSSQGTFWTDFGMAPSCPDPLDDRACADHNGPRGRTRYQTGEVEEGTEGVVCGNRRPRFKFPIRPYRRRNRERINA